MSKPKPIPPEPPKEEPISVEEWNRRRRAEEQADLDALRKLKSSYEAHELAMRMESSKKSQSTEPPPTDTP